MSDSHTVCMHPFCRHTPTCDERITDLDQPPRCVSPPLTVTAPCHQPTHKRCKTTETYLRCEEFTNVDQLPRCSGAFLACAALHCHCHDKVHRTVLGTPAFRRIGCVLLQQQQQQQQAAAAAAAAADKHPDVTCFVVSVSSVPTMQTASARKEGHITSHNGQGVTHARPIARQIESLLLDPSGE